MVTESSLDKDAQQLIEQLESIKLNQVDLQMDMDGRSYLLQFIPETRHSLNYLTGNSFILISKLNSELLQTIVPTVCIGSKHPNVSLMDLEHYIISNEEYINLTEHLIPMELKDARYICSLVSIGEFKLDIPIFCYHQDRNGIANTILGVRKHQSHTELIHCNEIDEKYTQIPDLQILKAKLNYELPFDLMAMQNSIQVSRYDILSPLGQSHDQSSSIQLILHEKGYHGLVAKPTNPTNIIIDIYHVPGHIDTDNHESTVTKRQQIDKLKNLLEIESAVLTPTPSNIESFISSIKENEGYELKSDFTTLPNRDQLDFLDAFWLFTIPLTEAQILDSLIAVINELDNHHLLPMIHKENGSELAGLIRKCIDLTRLETASDYQTLKEGLNENFDYWIQHWNLCVVDIGINKLKRDYYHYFVHSQLCVWDDLSPFFVSDDPSQLVRYLYKLQSVYELYVLIQSNVLMFPFEIMRMVIQTALKHCLESDDDCVRFQISIPKYQVNCTKLVHAFIDNFQASCWRMVWEADGRWFVQLERVEGMDVELDTDPDSYLVDSIAWKVKYGCSRMV